MNRAFIATFLAVGIGGFLPATCFAVLALLGVIQNQDLVADFLQEGAVKSVVFVAAIFLTGIVIWLLVVLASSIFITLPVDAMLRKFTLPYRAYPIIGGTLGLLVGIGMILLIQPFDLRLLEWSFAFCCLLSGALTGFFLPKMNA